MPQDPVAQRIPILELAAKLGLSLKGRTASCYNLSAHKNGSDNNPSLTFYPATDSYYCFSCRVSGDAITLVMKVKGFSFKQAVNFLMTMASSSPRPTLTSQTYSEECSPSPRSKEVYQRLLELSNPPTVTSPGGQYLLNRKISLEVAQKSHVLEMLNPNAIWQQLEKQFTVTELQAAGLRSSKGNFLFYYHQMLFFYMQDGRPQYVMARDIKKAQSLLKGDVQKPHTPKELALMLVKPPVPYMVEFLDESPGKVMLCEGHIDTLSAIQLGNKAIGVAGAMAFRPEWVSLFRKVSHVTVAFDNDDAGRRNAAELQAQFRMQGIKADAKIPAQVKDINDILQTIA